MCTLQEMNPHEQILRRVNHGKILRGTTLRKPIKIGKYSPTHIRCSISRPFYLLFSLHSIKIVTNLLYGTLDALLQILQPKLVLPWPDCSDHISCY